MPFTLDAIRRVTMIRRYAAIYLTLRLLRHYDATLLRLRYADIVAAATPR